MSTKKIPQKIFQTWENKDISHRFQKIIDTWREHNPNYEYYFHDSNDREEFIKNNFHSSIYQAYCKILPGAYKADLWRYCILYTYGGVYIDIDTLCLGSLDNFIKEETEFMATIDFNKNRAEGCHNIANGFIACVPNSKIMQSCIYKIVFFVENGIIPSSKLDFSGPGLLGTQVNIYLNRDEKDSFIGMEGNHNELCFLKFEEKTEYMMDTNRNILLQNKNGNPEIIQLYHEECKKANVISWLMTPALKNKDEVRMNPPPQHMKHRKSIALFFYGQFRSYKKNLENNLRTLDFLLSQNDVHVFILSDKKQGGNYSPENESEVKSIFQTYGCTVHFIRYIEDIPEYDNAQEQWATQNYYNMASTTIGSDKFTTSLIYRLHLINKLKNEYIERNGIHVDLHLYYRIVDTVITKNNSDSVIQGEFEKLMEDRTLLFGSHDTFYIGSKDPVDYMLGLGENFGINLIYNHAIWGDNGFVNAFSNADYYICKVRGTFCSEAQRAAHMYFSNYKYQNIRFDFTNSENPLNKNTLFDIKLCPERFG